jgi:hypothetical protein
MVKALEDARKAARRAQEAMYEGLCTIVEYRVVRDEKTKLSEEKEVIVAEGLPCRLSFEKLDGASQAEAASTVSQRVKLFLGPGVKVNSGSKIIVTQNGTTGEYSASGVPAIYATHQEIILGLFRGWA